MAWIAIHETILTGKLRMLSKEAGVSQDEALGILVRLWLWAINNADEFGNLTGADRDDIADVLTVGLSKGIDPVNIVDALIATNWIENSSEKLKIHNWDIWQEQWYKVLSRRKRDRERKASQKTCVSTEVKSVDAKQREKKGRVEYPEKFEEFWEKYPRKVGKGEAYKCYKARIADGWNPDVLIEAAETYAEQVKKMHTEAMYVKHPKTFLSATTPFADYIRKNEVQSDITDESDPFGDWR